MKPTVNDITDTQRLDWMIDHCHEFCGAISDDKHFWANQNNARAVIDSHIDTARQEDLKKLARFRRCVKELEAKYPDA